MLTIRLVLLVGAVGLTVGGCTGSPSAPPNASAASAEWAASLDTLSAQYPDASAEQIEIARAGIKSGGIRYEDYKNQFDAYVECLDAAALDHDVPVEWTSWGQPALSVGVALSDNPDDEASQTKLMDHCRAVNVALVEGMYMSQPSAVAWYENYIEGFRAALTICLEGKGVTVDASLTTRQIVAMDSEGGPDEEPCAKSTGMLDGLAANGPAAP